MIILQNLQIPYFDEKKLDSSTSACCICLDKHIHSLRSIYSKVGKCFLEHADSMRTAYTQYCLNHDKAEQLLEKFDGLPEMQKVSFRVSHFYPPSLALLTIVHLGATARCGESKSRDILFQYGLHPD